MNLIKSSQFGNVTCDFYQERNEIWMTRKQIGEALEYQNPADSIKMIHQRHTERLDQLSRMEQIVTPSGIQSTILYSPKGVYEICRWSQQPKADAFYDFVYEILEDLRTGRKSYQFNVPQTYLEALEALVESEKEKQLMLPKVESFDHFMSAENYQDMNIVSKSLGIGRNKLYEFLRRNKVLMHNNVPYQEHIDSGRFVVKEKPITMGDSTFNKPQTFVTPKGVAFIEKLLKEKKVG